ncbi:MAG: hypothetical protein KDK89_17880 [Alphaproteobacteria bacterium]|nr:hypothetical protein [Alphaproteobacteria bacterium]
MSLERPRGIAVADVGFTNTKIALFSPELEQVAEHKVASRHVEGPPYRHIDPEPMVALCRDVLTELDRILPVDAVVPTAHGAALACLDAAGNLALPVMDYTSEPPPDIVAGYRQIAPGFGETFCTLLPMALTHGLQLYWQQQAFPDDFARIRTVIPWIQYVGFRLSGTAVTEISSMSCQTHLMDTRAQTLSSLVRRQGWTPLFPPMAKAWETIGSLKADLRRPGFRGRGAVLGGVHDSTANFMRYVAAGLKAFSLVSTGTWSIAFDTSTPLDHLVEDRDTNTNTDVLGRTVACSRFFGGREFELVGQGAPAEAATLAMVQGLVAAGVMALPSFTDSGGPVPRSAGYGRIEGALPPGAEARASLAALYCALMVSEQLDAISSRHDIVVDGPFGQNPVLMAILAQLRRGQKLMVSDLRDGTTAGAAVMALVDDGRLPTIALQLASVPPAGIDGLQAYQQTWKERAYAHLA